GHRPRSLLIAVGKTAPTSDRNAHRHEISRPDDVLARYDELAGSNWTTFHIEPTSRSHVTHRNGQGEGEVFNTSHLRDPVLDFVEKGPSLGLRISDLRHVHLNVEHTFGPEPEIGVLGVGQAVHEQSPRNKQHETYADLDDHERLPNAVAGCRRQSMPVNVQSLTDVRSRRTTRRKQADEHSGRCCEGQGVRQYIAID